MSVCVDLSNDHFTRAWRPTTTDRSVQKRIDQQYVSYTCHPCEETHYFTLDEHNLDFKTMRQIRKDDATRYRALRWLVEEEASSPAPPLAAEKKRPLPMDDPLFADFGESDKEDLCIFSGPAEEEMHCPINCNEPKRRCRKMHKCSGSHCKTNSRRPHWAPAKDFKYYAHGAGNRQKGCREGNDAASEREEKTCLEPNRVRRREEAAAAGTSFNTNLPRLIEEGKAIINSATDDFAGDIDMYIYVVSLGGNKATLFSEAVSTIFLQTNTNTPILRTLQYDPNASLVGNGIVPGAERREAADDSHVFELGDTGFDKLAGGDLEAAMQEYGESVAAASGGRIKKLWRRRGAGGPKSGGPYKVGLIIIERNTDGTLGPGKWVRIDEF